MNKTSLETAPDFDFKSAADFMITADVIESVKELRRCRIILLNKWLEKPSFVLGQLPFEHVSANDSEAQIVIHIKSKLATLESYELTEGIHFEELCAYLELCTRAPQK